MRVILSTVLCATFALFALAASASQRAVIVSYAKDTPADVLEQAKNTVTASGGTITHEYVLIKAFAAKGPASVFETVATMGAKYNAVVEDDQQMHAQGGAF